MWRGTPFLHGPSLLTIACFQGWVTLCVMRRIWQLLITQGNSQILNLTKPTFLDRYGAPNDEKLFFLWHSFVLEMFLIWIFFRAIFWRCPHFCQHYSKLARIGPLYHIAVIGTIGRKSTFTMKHFYVFWDILAKLTEYAFKIVIWNIKFVFIYIAMLNTHRLVCLPLKSMVRRISYKHISSEKSFSQRLIFDWSVPLQLYVIVVRF